MDAQDLVFVGCRDFAVMVLFFLFLKKISCTQVDSLRSLCKKRTSSSAVLSFSRCTTLVEVIHAISFVIRMRSAVWFERYDIATNDRDCRGVFIGPSTVQHLVHQTKKNFKYYACSQKYYQKIKSALFLRFKYFCVQVIVQCQLLYELRLAGCAVYV